jgi:hypothetical protein
MMVVRTRERDEWREIVLVGGFECGDIGVARRASRPKISATPSETARSPRRLLV